MTASEFAQFVAATGHQPSRPRWPGPQLADHATDAGSRSVRSPRSTSPTPGPTRPGRALGCRPRTSGSSPRGGPGLDRLRPEVWNLTESEHRDGRTRFLMLKGGSAHRTEGSPWYFDGGVRGTRVLAKYLVPGLGLGAVHAASASGSHGTCPEGRHDRRLDDLLVVDASTLFAGPMTAMHLGDLGAEVVKVEHPRRPDPARGHGPEKDGHNLWWKTLGRNKRSVQLDLSTRGWRRRPSAAWRRRADVVIENFRPGHARALGPRLRACCASHNPGLVLARVTGFGQIGPYRRRPGFGTLAEAMSGFAASTGEPDGPPTLPPFGLADGIASLATAFAVMSRAPPAPDRPDAGRWSTSRSSSRSWPARAADLPVGPAAHRSSRDTATVRATTRPATPTAPPTVTGWRSRPARRASPSACCASSDAQDLVDEPWFAAGRLAGRARRRARRGRRRLDRRTPATRSIAEFERAEAAVAPIYTAQDIVADPQLPGARHHPSRRGPGSRRAGHAGPAVPALRRGRPHPLHRARPRRGHRRRAARARLHRRARSAALVTDGRGCGSRRSSRERAASPHVALRPGRPSRPRRQGSRVGGRRRHRRPRGRGDSPRPSRRARRATAAALAGATRPVQVRVNAPGTPWHEDDVAMVAGLPGAVGLRLPKASRPRPCATPRRRPWPAGPSTCSSSRPSASSGPTSSRRRTRDVARLGLGEADLRADLGRDRGGRRSCWARGRVVVAAAAAGLPPPAMSVVHRRPRPRRARGVLPTWVASWGSSGGRPSTRASCGASATAFTPTEGEVAQAREVVARRRGRRCRRRTVRWPCPTAGSSTSPSCGRPGA